METMTLNFALKLSPLDAKGSPQKGDVVTYDLRHMKASRIYP